MDLRPRSLLHGQEIDCRRLAFDYRRLSVNRCRLAVLSGKNPCSRTALPPATNQSPPHKRVHALNHPRTQEPTNRHEYNRTGHPLHDGESVTKAGKSPGTPPKGGGR